MNCKKSYMVALALAGCALGVSAYASRQRNLRIKARELQNALEVWENEGGIVLSSTAQPAEAP
jgi:hypothetical protein